MSLKSASALFALVVLTTACGNHSPASPTSPSSATSAAVPSPSPLSSGAIVSGTVVGVSGASRLRALAAPMTVSVTGTSISASVDNNGRFTLQNVPAGHVELHFTAAGVDARLSLDDIAEHQTITIVVRVSGSTAQLDDNEREDPNHNAEVEGIVTSTSPLMVAGKTITVSATTTIVHGDTVMTLSSIHVNDRIHVHGTATSATEIAATKIEVENGAETPGNAAGQETEIEGTVSSLLANGFTMNGAQTVTVTAKTVIRQDSHALTLANIHVGDRVEVKGTPSGSTITADTIEVKGPESGEDNGDDHGGTNPGNNAGAQVELNGTVSQRSASCPVNFFVGATHVFTDVNGATTEFKDTTCATLKNNDRVEVKGSKRSDGSVAATRVEKK